MSDPLNTALQTIVDSLPAIDQASYAAWVSEMALDDRARGAISSRLAAAADLPRLTIIIAGQSREEGLRRTLISLAAQIHYGFDVLLACSALHLEDAAELRRAFPELPISIALIDGDPGDVVALESAGLAHATAEYVAFLARGDILAPEAVAEVALALRRRPDAVVIYTDEDWIDSAGERSRPRFKTSWDPDGQLGFDLMGRFSPIQRGIAREAGGLRCEFGLAAHYDLHCRVAELAGPGRIVHLPAVLRHAAKQPRACAAAANDYAAAAREVAKAAAWRMEGVAVTVDPAPLAPWLNKVRWPDAPTLPLVSILLPTRDRAELVAAAARGVLEQTNYTNLELLILDNGSVEPETEALFMQLSRDSRVRLLRMPGPFNYSKLNNDGARAAKGDVLLLLNNDIEVVHPEWLHELVSLAIRDEIGCVGAKLLYADERIQHAGVNMAPHTGCAHVGRLLSREHPGDCGSLAVTRSHSAATAACLAIRREVFDEVGGLDEVHLQVGYNDVDLCLKTGDRGYRTVVTPFAVLFHLESVSRGPNDNPAKQKREKEENSRIVARWREAFLDDPFQNPNMHTSWDGPPRLVRPRRLSEWETSASVQTV